MKIRDYYSGDFAQISKIYKEAFGGYPWYENLSDQEVYSRLSDHFSRNTFMCLVAEMDDLIIGATWCDILPPELLENERGKILSSFVKKLSNYPVIWVRETIVKKEFQGQGVAKALKNEQMLILRKNYHNGVALTRMRDDNFAIINVNLKAGWSKTGIRTQSKLDSTKWHEYYYCVL